MARAAMRVAKPHFLCFIPLTACFASFTLAFDLALRSFLSFEPFIAGHVAYCQPDTLFATARGLAVRSGVIDMELYHEALNRTFCSIAPHPRTRCVECQPGGISQMTVSTTDSLTSEGCSP